MTTPQPLAPRTDVECGEYLIRAFVDDQLVAYAIRNLWGWDVLRRVSTRGRYTAIRTGNRVVAAGLLHHHVANFRH